MENFTLENFWLISTLLAFVAFWHVPFRHHFVGWLESQNKCTQQLCCLYMRSLRFKQCSHMSASILSSESGRLASLQQWRSAPWNRQQGSDPRPYTSNISIMPLGLSDQHMEAPSRRFKGRCVHPKGSFEMAWKLVRDNSQHMLACWTIHIFQHSLR